MLKWKWSHQFQAEMECLLDNSQPISPGDINNTDGDLIVYKNDIISDPTSSNKYIANGLIGGGAFGKVYDVTHQQTGLHLALKISSTKMESERQTKNEIAILNFININDPDEECNLNKMLSNFEYNNHICIVEPLYQSNLLNILESRDFKGFPCSAVQTVLRQASKAIKFMHHNKIIHADLKPENIMLCGPTDIKIIDFGGSKMNIPKDYWAFLQTQYYRAPEVILQLPINEKIDIWSLACVAAEFALGLPIFAGQTEHHMLQLIELRLGRFPKEMILDSPISSEYFDASGSVIKTGLIEDPCVYKYNSLHMNIRANTFVPPDNLELKKVEENVQNCLYDLLSGMLRYNPVERFSIDNVINHPFLRQKIPDGI